ncbi:hypothetical protein lbkm_1894 [Lachnospiraceae bacterium KM106-2]|nr:hypothetical protein lbkm_1894 [Lachnospiraceae bacterium KM106-2]
MLKNKKKIFQYVSVVAFVFMLGIGVMLASNTVSAASKRSVTVHVKNSIGWKKICIYNYDGDGEIAGSWPGTAMKKDKNNKGWYTYTFKTSSELNIVFNSGTKKGPQTNDIKHVKNNKKDVWVQISRGSKDKNDMGVAVAGKAKKLKKAPASYKKTATKKTTKKK